MATAVSAERLREFMAELVDRSSAVHLLLWGVPATAVLVETVLDRAADGDVAEAEATIERLAAAPTVDGFAMPDILPLRLRALLAQAHGDAATYAHLRDRYRNIAGTLASKGTSRGARHAMTTLPF